MSTDPDADAEKVNGETDGVEIKIVHCIIVARERARSTRSTNSTPPKEVGVRVHRAAQADPIGVEMPGFVGRHDSGLTVFNLDPGDRGELSLHVEGGAVLTDHCSKDAPNGPAVAAHHDMITARVGHEIVPRPADPSGEDLRRIPADLVPFLGDDVLPILAAFCG